MARKKEANGGGILPPRPVTARAPRSGQQFTDDEVITGVADSLEGEGMFGGDREAILRHITAYGARRILALRVAAAKNAAEKGE